MNRESEVIHMKTKREYSERKLMKSLNENKEKAKAFLDDDVKMEGLFRDFEEKLKLIPKVGKRASDLAVLLSMLRAYIKKQYTDVSLSTILLGIAGLIYVVNPMDVVPEYILGVGLLDDAAILGIILQAMHMDLNKYKKWQEENGKR
ncbi:MAG: DUF1232 domain-containing protein [Clostridiales bacterium]|nr:DUF1232 domain-containing protein [Clostridiales bacterium]